MRERPKLQELIERAKDGDEESFAQVVERFNPIIQKYVRRLGYDEAYSDLALWIVNAVIHYHSNEDRHCS